MGNEADINEASLSAWLQHPIVKAQLAGNPDLSLLELLEGVQNTLNRIETVLPGITVDRAFQAAAQALNRLEVEGELAPSADQIVRATRFEANRVEPLPQRVLEIGTAMVNEGLSSRQAAARFGVQHTYAARCAKRVRAVGQAA